MSKFTNPLDNVRVASPCSADWNEMYGDDRKRFCSDCKLNVYNLSDMTRQEAESLLLNWEGRLCVRFYRRADGTVLTKDCPVGWQAVKQKISRRVTAVFSLLAGLLGGFAGASFFKDSPKNIVVGEIPVAEPRPAIMGDMIYEPVQGQPELGEAAEVGVVVVGALPVKQTVKITRSKKDSIRGR